MYPTTPPLDASNRYIPGLDGLRAVSILLVIVSHCGFAKVPGSLGVTIFFFISGYLITTLLFRELAASETIAIGRFYVRRYVRLMPELLVYTLVASVLSYTFFDPHRSEDIWAALFYFTNYLRIVSPNMHDAPFGFGLMWSLAVEEHFYLTWPWIFSLCAGRRDKFLRAALAFIALGVVARFLAAGAGRPVDYLRYASECRIDSIGYGCLLAIWQHRFHHSFAIVRRRSAMVPVAGLVLVIVFTYGRLINLAGMSHEIFVYVGQGVGLLLIFAACYLGEHQPTLRMLEFRPLRFIGRVSYGAYLWHYAILSLTFSFLGYREPLDAPLTIRLPMTVVVVAASIAAGYLSFKLILAPLSRARHRFAFSPTVASPPFAVERAYDGDSEALSATGVGQRSRGVS